MKRHYSEGKGKVRVNDRQFSRKATHGGRTRRVELQKSWNYGNQSIYLRGEKLDRSLYDGPIV